MYPHVLLPHSAAVLFVTPESLLKPHQLHENIKEWKTLLSGVVVCLVASLFPWCVALCQSHPSSCCSYVCVRKLRRVEFLYLGQRSVQKVWAVFVVYFITQHCVTLLTQSTIRKVGETHKRNVNFIQSQRTLFCSSSLSGDPSDLAARSAHKTTCDEDQTCSTSTALTCWSMWLLTILKDLNAAYLYLHHACALIWQSA